MTFFTRRATSLALASLLAACGATASSDSVDPPDAALAPDSSPDASTACVGNQPPAAPTILTPALGRLDVTADDLAIAISDYVDPDGDPVRRAVIELWDMDDVGGADDHVWTAVIDAPGPNLSVTLADGAFEPGYTGLGEWKDYLIRAYYTDDHDGCEGRGEDSPIRTFRTDDGSIAFFDDTQVKEIRITLSPETIAALNAQAYPPGCVPFERQYYRGDVVVDGVSYPDVGVKTKGGCGSARNLDGKPGFKISLSWDDPEVEGCPEERRHAGQKTLTLNNNVQDPSQSHERLGYQLYRAMGSPVSRIATVQVYVNDVYYGLYQNLESINRRFVTRNFGSGGGMLYEGTYWCDLYDGNAQDDDSGCLTREFREGACVDDVMEGEDPLTYDPLRGLIAQLDAAQAGGGSFYPEVEAYLAFDDFLSTWAVEAYMAHWDGYNFNIVNNYRFYHDPSVGKWTLIPTGIDQTFNGDINPWGVQGRIAQLCLADQDCKDAYAARLVEVLNKVDELDLPAVSTAIHAQLRPYIEANPGRDQSLSLFDQRNTWTLNFLNGRRAVMENHLVSGGYGAP
jgi:hypothetical protein